MDCKKKVAIIGAGPAGCMSAYFAAQNQSNEITVFDFTSPLRTLLYTGGGRCNLAYAEYDFKELAKFYPRGEKFLYSIFSQFATADTIDFFKTIGIETYIQDDMRIFPTSNSAKDVREKFLNRLKKCTFIKEKVEEIIKNETTYTLKTKENHYSFDKVVLAVGGHAGFELAKSLGHKIIEPRPSLTGLITAENFKFLQGVSLRDVVVKVDFENRNLFSAQGDILFTHEGISGPLTYKISSLCARLDYSKSNPLLLRLNFLKEEINLQDLLNSNSKKDIRNLISEFVPKSLAECVLEKIGITFNVKCYDINGKMRDLIYKNLSEFEIQVISPSKEGEVVTSGGVSLTEINPKTMQSKLVEGLYFCGEVIDVDGFCGGFNLQNCWSTGYITGKFA